MNDIIDLDEQIKNPNLGIHHLVILGAGASRAACPNGDRNGKKLPLMNEMGEIININSILTNFGFRYDGGNFEEFYSNFIIKQNNPELISEIERAIYNYFSSLVIPDEPTIYDYLILSLREKDVIATFNWDPLLFQACQRNKYFPLPHILFLHGNTAVGYCPSTDHQVFGTLGANCPNCAKKFVPLKLLYPITNKDYSDDPFIKKQWKTFEKVIDHTFILTIFGYSAPTTDAAAREFMNKAWDKTDNKKTGEIEIINIEEHDKLHIAWDPFIVRSHYRICGSYFDSLLCKWPRRSCEKIWNQFYMLRLAEENPQPKNVDLKSLQEWHLPLTEFEIKENNKN